MKKIEKILFLRPEHIGDYGLSLPALKSLKEKFPKASIDVVVGPWNKRLAEATPYVDRVIVFDLPLIKRHVTKKEILKIIFSGERIRLLKFIRRINKNRYDLLVSLSDRKFNKILLKLIRAKEKILGTEIRNTGFDERKRISGIFSRHNIIIEGKLPKLNFSSEDKIKVKKILQKDKGFKKKIILHTLTPLKEKNWSKKNWVKLIKDFQKKNYVFYLVGTKEQKEELDNWKGDSKKVRNLAGKLDLVQLVLFMEKCDLVVGNDSGPVHLAELTDTKTISLFGPTDEKMWGTPKSKGLTIKRDEMEDILVKEVVEAVRKFV